MTQGCHSFDPILKFKVTVHQVKISDQEKKEEIWLSPMTKAPTSTEIYKKQRYNTKYATKKLQLHNNCGPT